jgi:hypothetical protein
MTPSNSFLQGCFPDVRLAPFGDLLETLFFDPAPTVDDFPIHGPNVVRLLPGLLSRNPEEFPGLLQGGPAQRNACWELIVQARPEFLNALSVADPSQIQEFLKIAALYHDIGKTIRRENHPHIGANLLRLYDEGQRRAFAELLAHDGEGPDVATRRQNRFWLVCSVVQHHDKFGVSSTGEAGLPIFSDVPYFLTTPRLVEGVKKNITCVMLLNLADIAGVFRGPDPGAETSAKARARTLAQSIAAGLRNKGGPDPEQARADLMALCERYCLGLERQKVEDVLEDWRRLIRVVDETKGQREHFKRELLALERNPARTLQRIHRLLRAAIRTARADELERFMTPISIEAILTGLLGAHQVTAFAGQLAGVGKLDYGLGFFSGVVEACVAQATDGQAGAGLAALDDRRKAALAEKITTIFVKVLHGLVTRYTDVLGQPRDHPHRFGFQLRALRKGEKITAEILRLLCGPESREHVALAWLAEEVTIWSMD